MCNICLQENPEEPMTTLECGHSFHTSCILKWFRGPSSTCPMCRAEPQTILAYPDVIERCRMLRRKAGAKHAPPSLKRAVLALRKAEEDEKNARNEYRAYMTPEIRQILLRVRSLRHRSWTLKRRIMQRKRAVGLGVYPGIELPPLARRSTNITNQLILNGRMALR